MNSFLKYVCLLRESLHVWQWANAVKFSLSPHLVCNSRASSWINARSICTYTARSNYHHSLFSSFCNDENFSHCRCYFEILIISIRYFVTWLIVHFLTLYSTTKSRVSSLLFFKRWIILNLSFNLSHHLFFSQWYLHDTNERQSFLDEALK